MTSSALRWALAIGLAVTASGPRLLQVGEPPIWRTTNRSALRTAESSIPRITDRSALVTAGVSVWYRGTPAGVPVQDELAVIRALGFTGVTWPTAYATAVPTLRQMTQAVTLTLDVRARGAPLTPSRASSPGATVDVDLTTTPAAAIPALVWRAIAHGARAVAFDAGAATAAGVTDAAGDMAPWVVPARALSRQLSANAQLFAGLDAGTTVPLLEVTGPRPADVEIRLLQTPRVCVVIATNLSPGRVVAVARLPRDVPYAPWASLIDGEQMGMRVDPAGPLWRVTLDPGSARVYLASRTR